MRSSASNIIEGIEILCQKKHIKLTPKRRHVLLTLIQSAKALSAYEIMAILKNQKRAELKAMSVYRILKFLQDQHLIHKLQLINKYILCSHLCTKSKHKFTQFVICNQCGVVKELTNNPELTSKLKKTIEDAGYQFSNHQLEHHCLCDNCASDEPLNARHLSPQIRTHS